MRAGSGDRERPPTTALVHGCSVRSLSSVSPAGHRSRAGTIRPVSALMDERRAARGLGSWAPITVPTAGCPLSRSPDPTLSMVRSGCTLAPGACGARSPPSPRRGVCRWGSAHPRWPSVRSDGP